MKYSFGDIVLLKFPFTNQESEKRRPALVLNHSEDGDIIVCRITSKIYETQFDVKVPNWKASGLKLPSVIRVHKIATLSEEMVEIVLGQIDNDAKSEVKKTILLLAQ